MATRTVNVNAPATLPRVERFVRNIEEMSPVVPLVVCLMWGTALILLSFAFGVSRLPYGVKHVGWIYELNWSSTFAFFIPLSLYFSSSVLTSIPQIISALARGRMVRSEEGTLADSAALILNWRHRAGKTAMLAAVLGGIGFIVSWIMYFAYCIGPAFRGTVPLLHSWQNATSTAPGSTSPGELAIFGFLAYTSQGAAIACYVYYILMIFTFAAWVFDYTTFEPGSGIFPDLTDSDTRYGFEQFEPFIENVLFASIAFFFQFFMTRLYYIYMADTSSTSMFDLIARTMGPGFGKDVFALFVHADASLFDFGSDLHLQDTMMIVATLVVVLSAFLVPAIIVRQAARRSKIRLQEVMLNDSGITKKWYDLNLAEAQAKLNKMTFWPIRYAQPAQLLVLMLLAASCFFFYKLTLILVAAILYQGLKQFDWIFKKELPDQDPPTNHPTPGNGG
jgi:hypothetical protein